MIPLLLALAATLGPNIPNIPNSIGPNTSTAAPPGRGRRCEPYAETCRGSVIYTCVAGRWVRGLDCARAGRRDRVTVCEVEPGGVAVCVESGGASPFPGDRR